MLRTFEAKAAEKTAAVQNLSEFCAGQVARSVMDALRPLAIDVSESRIAPRGTHGTADAALILDAAFLVEPAALERFQRELTAIVDRHSSQGFRFDFTGPWPLYHFVQSQIEQSVNDI